MKFSAIRATSSTPHRKFGAHLSRAFVVVLLVSVPFVFSQGTSKDRRNNFGESLTRFGKKGSARTSGKDKTIVPAHDDIIRVATNMVVTNALVINPNSKAVVGLKKEDFIVTEDGVPQETELFSNGSNSRIPNKIVFIAEVGSRYSYVRNGLGAAKKFVDMLAPDDQMAIVSFDLKLRQDFTNDKKLLKATLDDLSSVPRLSLYDYSALVASLLELFERNDLRPTVVFQTHGGEFPFLKPASRFVKMYCPNPSANLCKERNFAFADVIETVERSRATIYTIVPGPQVIGSTKEQQIARIDRYKNDRRWEEFPNRTTEKFRSEYSANFAAEAVTGQEAVANVAAISGGFTSFMETPGEAESIYGSIFTSIGSRYTIGYYPKSDGRDGERRSVKIEVKGHPEYMIMARKVYFVDKSAK